MRGRGAGCQPRLGGVSDARAGTAAHLRAGAPLPNPATMDETASAADRVDAAIARIEAAIAARAESRDALARRHAALKARMAEAVSALDDVIARRAPR